MATETYRTNVNSLAIVASAAFAGGNLLIGLSMGSYWMGLDPLQFVEGFWRQFVPFAFTIIPLFALTLVGLVLSARLDWNEPDLRRLWLVGMGLYVATSMITLGYHLPTNLKMRSQPFTAEEAAAVRSMWLTLHVPRILLAFGIPLVSLAAVMRRARTVFSE